MSTDRVDVILRMRNSREFQQEANRSGRAIRGVGRDADRANRQASKGARGFGMLRRRVDESGRSAHRGAGMLRRAAGAAAGLAAAYVGIGAAKRAVSTTIDLTKAQIGLTRNLKLSNRQAGEWAAVARVRGIDNKSLNMSFTTLARNVNQAAMGGKSQLDMFKRLGITTKDLKRGQGDFNYMLMKTADGFGKLRGGTLRQEAAQKLLGRGYQSVLPLFTEGSKSFREQAAMANKYGAVLGGKPIKTQRDLIKVQRELQYAQLGMQVQFATRIAPKLIRGFQLILSAARPLRGLFRWAEDHPKIAKFAAGLLLAGVAARKFQVAARASKELAVGMGNQGRRGVGLLRRALGGARNMARRLLGTAGRAGGDALATNAANTASTQVPRRMSRKRGSFQRAGRSVGRAGGIAAGTSLATATAGTAGTAIPGQMGRQRGKLRGTFRGIGRGLGLVMGAAVAIEIGLAIRDELKKNPKYGQYSGKKGWGELYRDVMPGNQRPRKLRRSGFGRGFATGGPITVAAGRSPLIPRGEDTLIGARFGEFMVREPAVRKVGMPAMHALNEGRVEAVPALAGMGHRTIVVPLHLDRREIGRAVAHDSADQKARS